MSENRIESAAGSDENSGSCFVDPLVREFFVERFFRGEWLRNNVGTKTLKQAKEWAADPTLPAMADWPVRIVQIDTQITRTIIPFPNAVMSQPALDSTTKSQDCSGLAR